MGWGFYVAQILGALTTLSIVVANQLKDMRHVLLCQMVVNLLAAVSSALLGGLSGAWICGVAILQTGLLYILDKKGASDKTKTYLLWLFAFMYIAGTAVVFSSWRDLVSCAGAMLFLLAIGQKQSSRYRVCICAHAILWLVYYLSILSFGSALTNAVGLVSAVVGIIRLDLKRSKEA
jgi:hypothetical protein